MKSRITNLKETRKVLLKELEAKKLFHVHWNDTRHTDLLIVARTANEAIRDAEEFVVNAYKDDIEEQLDKLLSGKNGEGRYPEAAKGKSEDDLQEEASLMIENYQKQARDKISVKPIAIMLNNKTFELKTDS